MKKPFKLILKIALWGMLVVILLFALDAAYISLRYSPGYMVNEFFRDLGTPYDFRILAARKLSASPVPFMFDMDASREALVREAFESNPAIPNLDEFLSATGTQAFLVIQDDSIIYERYFMDFQRDSIVTSFSVAKSFDSALIGIAIEEGYIDSVDDPITEYLPELAQRDARFGEITIRHLLTMASGLRYNDNRFLLPEDDNLTYIFDDLRHLALTETEVVESPGVTFVYNNYNPLLLGLILERATGGSVTSYLQEKLWTPLGMEFDGSWSLDSEQSGFEKMESGLNATAIDFAKFGRLYLNEGNWDGVQIISAEWVRDSVRDNGLIQDAPLFYGYMWWGEKCNPDRQDFFAAGNYGQFIYVSPAINLIIVRNGANYALEGEQAAWGEVFCKFTQALP